jgi:hypothetical protein
MNPSSASSVSDLEIEIQLFHQPAIDSARKMILWAGAIYPMLPLFLFALLARFAGASVFASTAFILTFGIGCAVFAAHVALWWWAKRAPLAATSVALLVFVAYHVVGVAYGVGPNWIVMLIGLFVLGRAVLAGYRVHKLRSTAARERQAA